MKLYWIKIINYRNYQVFVYIQGLVAGARFCMQATSKEFSQGWNWNLSGINIKYQDILFKKHSKKLLLLMDSFWVEIGGRGININWLVKVRSHLNKVENEQTKSKQKRLPALLLFQVILIMNKYFCTFILRQIFFIKLQF